MIAGQTDYRIFCPIQLVFIKHVPGLFYAKSPIHGRGMLCAHDLAEGDVVEIAPVIELPVENAALLDQTALFDYYFLWGEQFHQPAVALGYASLYNHSNKSNLEYTLEIADRTVQFTARQWIPAGTELTIDYRDRAGRPGGELWFDVRTADEPT